MGASLVMYAGVRRVLCAPAVDIQCDSDIYCAFHASSSFAVTATAIEGCRDAGRCFVLEKRDAYGRVAERAALLCEDRHTLRPTLHIVSTDKPPADRGTVLCTHTSRWTPATFDIFVANLLAQPLLLDLGDGTLPADTLARLCEEHGALQMPMCMRSGR